jgi:hypothetical protein
VGVALADADALGDAEAVGEGVDVAEDDADAEGAAEALAPIVISLERAESPLLPMPLVANTREVYLPESRPVKVSNVSESFSTSLLAN